MELRQLSESPLGGGPCEETGHHGLLWTDDVTGSGLVRGFQVALVFLAKHALPSQSAY